MSLKYDFISSMCRETSWIMGTVGRVYTISRAVLTHFEPNGGTDGIVIEHLMQIWVFRSITDIILYIVSEFCAKTSITQCARIFKGCQAIGAWGACQSAHTPSHCEVHNFLNNWSNWTKKTVPKSAFRALQNGRGMSIFGSLLEKLFGIEGGQQGIGAGIGP